jgi:hypothetical protein
MFATLWNVYKSDMNLYFSVFLLKITITILLIFFITVDCYVSLSIFNLQLKSILCSFLLLF